MRFLGSNQQPASQRRQFLTAAFVGLLLLSTGCVKYAFRPLKAPETLPKFGESRIALVGFCAGFAASLNCQDHYRYLLPFGKSLDAYPIQRQEAVAAERYAALLAFFGQEPPAGSEQTARTHDLALRNLVELAGAEQQTATPVHLVRDVDFYILAAHRVLPPKKVTRWERQKAEYKMLGRLLLWTFTFGLVPIEFRTSVASEFLVLGPQLREVQRFRYEGELRRITSWFGKVRPADALSIPHMPPPFAIENDILQFSVDFGLALNSGKIKARSEQ